MRQYVNLKEVKQDLPYILEAIDDYVDMYEATTILLEDLQRRCVDECIHPDHNYGWWTTQEVYTETFKSQRILKSKIDYLKWLVKRIPDCKHI